MGLGAVSCCVVGLGVVSWTGFGAVSCCAVGLGVVSCCTVELGLSFSCCAVGLGEASWTGLGAVSCCAVGLGVVSWTGLGVVSCCAVGLGVVSCCTVELGLSFSCCAVGLRAISCCTLEMMTELSLKSDLTSAGENWWIPYSPPQMTKAASKAFDQGDHRRWRPRRSTRIITPTPAEPAQRQWRTQIAARAWRCRAA